jgi:hypothetical protein
MQQDTRLGYLKIALYLIGIIPLVTGLMSSCPRYTIFGLRTCPLKK